MPSVIKEIKRVNEMLTYFQHDTFDGMLLVLDLDNTTIQSTKALGGDQWFTALLGHAIKHISNIDLALECVLPLYCAVQHHVKAEAVEPGITFIIRALQDLGVPVLALTARDIGIMEPTLRQLNDIGIDFSKSAIAQEESDAYAKGIIFCNGCDKGVALKTFLSNLSHGLKHVVMLDDKEKYLHQVASQMESLDIQFSGLRYAYLDEKVKAFDMHEANVQLAHLREHLPIRAREKIDQIQLIAPHHVDEAKSSVVLAGHFFHHKEGVTTSAKDVFSESRPRSASF